MKVAITGASGFVGRALVASLMTRGDEVHRLVRRDAKPGEIHWDPDRPEIESSKLEGMDVIVHLAGENIAGRRWSEGFKEKILESRVKGTKLIADTITKLATPPRVFISASAVGIYGDRGDSVLTEDSRGGEGFLADVCRAWEACADRMIEAPTRLAKVRFGMILSRDGGSLTKMLTPFRLGLGGVIGSGRQYMSWVTLHDVVRAIEFIIDRDDAGGVFNVTAPVPTTNREFTKTLGKVLHRPTLIPAPVFALRMALGEMADELLLSSARVVPERLEKIGFHFTQPELEGALRSLLN